MELNYKQYSFKIKKGNINTIIGNGINLEELLDSYKDSKNIGFVINPVTNYFLYSTVKKELTKSFKESNHHDSKKIIDSLRIVGMNIDNINKKIKELSDSEKYLLKLASILIMNPNILILENPNAYLDAKNINNLIRIIKTIKRRYNKTIIIFSNNSDFVNSITDYIFIINSKGIISKGNKYQIFENNELLKENQIQPPKIIEFENTVLKTKKINLGKRDNINDLIKDIYYYK